jgi:hypothetical protein
MRSRWLADLPDRGLALLPAGATAAAEGAWVAVVYAAFGLLPVGRSLVLEVWAFVVAAGVGIVLVRRIRGRGAAPAIAGVAVLVGLLGWSSDAAVRAMLASGAVAEAIATHQAGWLLGFAVWRGSRHPDPASDDLVVGSLLAWGVPGLAVPWLIGSATSSRSAFIDAALPATLVFVAAGLVAVGLTRLDALGHAVGVDWRRNRTWLGLLVGIVALVAAIGAPIALLLGASLGAVLGVILGPAGNAIGAVGTVVRTVADDAAHHVGGGGPAVPGAPTPSSPGVTLPGVPGWVGVFFALAVGLGLVAAGVAGWRRMRGGPPVARWRPPKAEERRISLPDLSIRLPRPRLPHLALARRSRPRTASQAYVALLEELQRQERLVRRPTESPGAHTHRLRDQGDGVLAIDLLAADFQLERYAGRLLSPTETARAIRRSRTAKRPAGRTAAR